MESGKRRMGPAIVAVLVAVNLLLGLSTVHAAPDSTDCKSPENPDSDIICKCFGDVCKENGSGFYYCEMGWSNVGGDEPDWVLDAVWEEEPSGPVWTLTNCTNPT